MYVGDTALHLAAAGHRAGIVKMLLVSGADPNSARNMRRSTPLLYAADGCPGSAVWDPKKQVETIRRLLEGGADLHWQDKNGASALHRAVRTRCAAAVRFLLEAGSDSLLRNKPGSTPFHLAVQNTGRGGSGLPAAVDCPARHYRGVPVAGRKPAPQRRAGEDRGRFRPHPLDPRNARWSGGREPIASPSLQS